MTAKLTITLALAVVLAGFLVPGLAEVAHSATAPGGLDDAPPQYAIGPVVSATLLTVNVLLATRRPTRLRRQDEAACPGPAAAPENLGDLIPDAMRAAGLPDAAEASNAVTRRIGRVRIWGRRCRRRPGLVPEKEQKVVRH